MQVLPQNMRAAARKGFINATDCADYLAKKGIPFRDAYKAVGKLVLYCAESGRTLEQLTPDEFRSVSEAFGEDIFEALDLQNCVSQRKSRGGPAPQETSRQISQMESFVKAHSK
jgi:argininosuccinate lyase